MEGKLGNILELTNSVVLDEWRRTGCDSDCWEDRPCSAVGGWPCYHQRQSRCRLLGPAWAMQLLVLQKVL